MPIDAEDLVQQTVLSLIETLSRDSRYEDTPADPEQALQDLYRLGVTIMRRRQVDAYRRGAALWAESIADESIVDSLPADAPRVEEALVPRQMVVVLISELAKMSSADREALLRSIGFRDALPGPVSAADRQRLSRLRRRLLSSIRVRIGPGVEHFLIGNVSSDE